MANLTRSTLKNRSGKPGPHSYGKPPVPVTPIVSEPPAVQMIKQDDYDKVVQIGL